MSDTEPRSSHGLNPTEKQASRIMNASIGAFPRVLTNFLDRAAAEDGAQWLEELSCRGSPWARAVFDELANESVSQTRMAVLATECLRRCESNDAAEAGFLVVWILATSEIEPGDLGLEFSRADLRGLIDELMEVLPAACRSRLRGYGSAPHT